MEIKKLNRPSEFIKVTHINTTYPCGGSGRIAMEIHEGINARGHSSQMVLGNRGICKEAVELGRESYWPRIDKVVSSLVRGAFSQKHLRKLFVVLGYSKESMFKSKILWEKPTRAYYYLKGLENFSYSGAKKWMDSWNEPPNVVHLHDLFTEYFDLRLIRELSQKSNVVWTLHNEWAFTGLCHYSLDCRRWESGCGDCPYLDEYEKFSNPKVDRTSANLLRKSKIYQKSKIIIVSPSRWLLERAKKSILTPAIEEAFVIPNGVDVDRFFPKDRSEARVRLGFLKDERIILFVGNRVKSNKWRVWDWMRKSALEASRIMGKPLHFVCVGEALPDEVEENVKISFYPFNESPEVLVDFYCAADFYFQLSRLDNFPTTILEAMSCGLPVVSTRVGGIPEQVIEGENGFLVDPGNITQGAEAISQMYKSDEDRKRMGSLSRERVLKFFRKDQMIDRYLEIYRSLQKRPRK